MQECKISSDWVVQAFDQDGTLKWEESVSNLVVSEGLAFILDTLFSGSAYTAAWYVGLKDDGLVASSDTLVSHPGWVEITGYAGDRKAAPFNPAVNGYVDNASLRPEFDITVNDTIYGMFLCNVPTGTAGKLLSVINFVTPRAVSIGDTLKVSIVYNLIGG